MQKPALGTGEPLERLDKAEFAAALAPLHKRLKWIQSAWFEQKRAAIIVLEGWDAAGKGGIISHLIDAWDPKLYSIHPIKAPTADELARHYLWRFWTRLPGRPEIAIFDRSWYGRVLVERVEGFATPAEWQRAYDEINAFEQMQLDAGVRIVKLFVHVDQATQDKRLRERLEEPWKHWKVNADDFRNRERRAAYIDAIEDMFAHTHRAAAPWIVIPGNDDEAARIAAMTAIADALEQGLDLTPVPLDPELIKMAETVFGKLNLG